MLVELFLTSIIILLSERIMFGCYTISELSYFESILSVDEVVEKYIFREVHKVRLGMFFYLKKRFVLPRRGKKKVGI